ncbi:hypothetical protein QLH51_05165 [Sphingomonas sp. 2R-10]|uniref:hypothetical protein n=1 Tax=Sphingomonas sp. 2R-10 TaxID=3045148 RepID=UPI0013DDFC4F|nr:hypothetical protein [Sphingomonas sp. 2R-10]MDJ0276196.1 hypothetical protein [Sphingomonas sp. 2R-10]
MGLTEKTLEINTTHELLSLGHGIWSILWGAMPRPMAPSTVVGPSIYATGLSLKGEKHHGWDIPLDLPAITGRPARVAFLQFKLGKQLTYSLYPGSTFGSPKSSMTRHVLFGINNNSDKTQHGRLRATGIASGTPHSAIYALPLLTEDRQVRRALGNLLANTLFFAVPDVDAAAAHNPIVNGIERAIAVSNLNPRHREIRSKPVPFEARDIGGRLIGEIAKVRLQRSLAAWASGPPPRGPGRARPGYRVAQRVASYLASFVGVDGALAQQAFDRPLSVRPVAPFPDGTDDQTSELRTKRIFDVAEAIMPTLRSLDNGAWWYGEFDDGPPELLAEAPIAERWRLGRGGKDSTSLSLDCIVV